MPNLELDAIIWLKLSFANHNNFDIGKVLCGYTSSVGKKVLHYWGKLWPWWNTSFVFLLEKSLPFKYFQQVFVHPKVSADPNLLKTVLDDWQ